MFSNDSRWDRHLPHQEHTEEPIEVGAVFEKGEIFPKFFFWKKRKTWVKEITFHWKDKRGKDVLHFFTVTDGTNLYQIYLNNTYMYWRLANVCPLEQ